MQERSGHLDRNMANWYALTATERDERRNALRKCIPERMAREKARAAAAEKRRAAAETRAATRALPRAAGKRRQRDD